MFQSQLSPVTCIAFNAIISVSVDLKERFSAPDLAFKHARDSISATGEN